MLFRSKKVLEKDNTITVIITAHISDEDRGQELLKMVENKNVYLYANGGELLNIGAVINKGTVYFGGSTGPTHIAGSLQKKIVAIYPKKLTQSIKRWGVYGNNKVSYIIPDMNTKENYKDKNFQTYDDEIENQIVNEIMKKMEA